MKYNTSIFAVIVLYKIKLTESKTFLSLTAALKNSDTCLDLLVYDNSPQFNKDLSQHHENWNIIYLPDEQNGGVSKAYNTAAAIAAKKGANWLLLLDQDTNFPAATIHQYLSAISKYPNEKLFVPVMLTHTSKIISPGNFVFMRGSYAAVANPGINSLNKRSTINCGMCIDIDAFFKNNGYNNLIKLDFSDHDFIKRFKKSVGERFIVIDLKVYHELSTETRNNLNADLVRFAYYLEGAKYMTASGIERFLLKINVMLRTLKLSITHRSFAFFIKLFKWI